MNEEEQPCKEETEVERELYKRNSFNGWMDFQHSRRFALTTIRRERFTGEYQR